MTSPSPPAPPAAPCLDESPGTAFDIEQSASAIEANKRLYDEMASIRFWMQYGPKQIRDMRNSGGEFNSSVPNPRTMCQNVIIRITSDKVPGMPRGEVVRVTREHADMALRDGIAEEITLEEADKFLRERADNKSLTGRAEAHNKG